MTELRYIRLPISTGNETAGRMETELDSAISIDEESGINYPNTVRSTRNRYRYRAMPTPQAAPDPEGVVVRIDRHDLHCHPRYSQPEGLSLGKVQRSVSAAWQRLKQRMRRGVRPNDR
jgi:hypothetical protein